MPLRALLSCIAVVLATPAIAAVELVMIEEPGCVWCMRWNDEIAPAYPKTAEGRAAPLRRVDLRDLPQGIAFDTRPVFTPTFVLIEDGRELDRLEGYPGEDFFWPLLARMLREHTDFETDRP